MKRIIAILLVVVLITLVPHKVNAGFLNGDESIAGASYLLDCIYQKKQPDEKHIRLLLLAEEYRKDIYEVTEEEYEILCRIVEAEATGGDVVQKANVASCVMARVESEAWANTIKGVVFEHYGSVYQFTPISDGRYYSVTITDSTRQAVNRVISFGKTHDCTWFCSDGSYKKKDKNGNYTSYHRRHHTWVFFDGEHHYFYD